MSFVGCRTGSAPVIATLLPEQLAAAQRDPKILQPIADHYCIPLEQLLSELKIIPVQTTAEAEQIHRQLNPTAYDNPSTIEYALEGLKNVAAIGGALGLGAIGAKAILPSLATNFSGSGFSNPFAGLDLNLGALTNFNLGFNAPSLALEPFKGAPMAYDWEQFGVKAGSNILQQYGFGDFARTLEAAYLPSYSGAEPVATRPPGPSNLPMVRGTRSLKPGFIIMQALADRTGVSLRYVWELLRKIGLIAFGAMFQLTSEQLLQIHAARPKRRRMRVTNVRALRRSMRRLKGFSRLARRVEGQLKLGRGRSRSRSGACRVCRSNPCSC